MGRSDERGACGGPLGCLLRPYRGADYRCVVLTAAKSVLLSALKPAKHAIAFVLRFLLLTSLGDSEAVVSARHTVDQRGSAE